MMMKSFCKPKIKVGTEWVTKGQNIDQSTQSVAGIARGIYDRVFRFLVEKCNQTLVDPTMKKSVFIGVLDIAGEYFLSLQGVFHFTKVRQNTVKSLLVAAATILCGGFLLRPLFKGGY